MGADLIGYMVKGPKKIKFSKAKATKFFKEHSQDGVMSYCTTPGYEDDEEFTETITLGEFLTAAAGFVSEWNSCDYRDMAWRIFSSDPKQKVVFAGEMSWGDEPEGAGYQTFKTMSQLKLDELYGLE